MRFTSSVTPLVIFGAVFVNAVSYYVGGEHRQKPNDVVLSAQETMAMALQQAKEDQKNVFVTFGWEGCGPCKRLEAVLKSETVAPILEKDFVLVKIDIEKMDDGPAYMDAMLKKSGNRKESIPWYFIADADEQILIASTTDSGKSIHSKGYNIGYPSGAAGYIHFQHMLKEHSSRITEEEFDMIRSAFFPVP